MKASALGRGVVETGQRGRVTRQVGLAGVPAGPALSAWPLGSSVALEGHSIGLRRVTERDIRPTFPARGTPTSVSIAMLLQASTFSAMPRPAFLDWPCLCGVRFAPVAGLSPEGGGALEAAR